MPTTTNYGWTTPADTDLVKDGAAAIRTLGNGIDSSLVDLKGGTTGQILSKASNTDLDYTWIANDQGDITEVQAGVGISVASGTGPIPVITNSSTDLITTAGDLLYGTAADTVARLGIGTAGQVLKVNSSATAPEWGAASSTPTFVGCSASSSVDLTLSNNTFTAITWNTERFDTDGFHNTSTNTSRMTIPSGKAGKYLVTGNVDFDGNATGVRELRIYKNGTAYLGTWTAASTAFPSANVVAIMDLSVADYVELYAKQDSGSNQTLYISTVSGDFSIVYLGA